MHINRPSSLCRVALAAIIPLAALVPLAALASPAHVDVVLEDSSTNPQVTGMVLAATPSVVKAGQVVLHAVNSSHKLVHEVILVRLNGDAKALPVDPADSKVQEKRIQDPGEVSDLAPLMSGDLTAKLAPGRYALICNQPGH